MKIKTKNHPSAVYMKKAVKLARQGIGFVHPNPLVGAVLVKNHKIIGQGFHEYFGGAHAEVNAILSAGGRANGSTLYVTLEPCAHFGKTPPCVDFIISHKIREVVVGAADPNPLVSGKGLRRLRAAGIKVQTGFLKDDCEALNRDLDHWVRTHRPYGVVKVAQSLDGKIATKTGESRWISSETSRLFSHRLRAESDAILVGVNTVIKDNPRLNVRLGKYRHQPMKVILDSRLRVPPSAKLFSKISKGSVILAVTSKASHARIKMFRRKAEVLVVREKNGKVDLQALFLKLARRGVVRILIEGGGEVIADALSRKLVQEVYFFISPKIIGGKNAIASVSGEGIASLKDALNLRQVKIENSGSDLLVNGRL